MHFPISFYSILSRAPSLTFSFIFFQDMRNWRSIFRGETTNCQQETYGSKSWAFIKKLILHPMMHLLKPGSSYCREKYLWDNKNKDPETFNPSTNKFNKNLFIHGAISYQVESLNFHLSCRPQPHRFFVVNFKKF